LIGLRLPTTRIAVSVPSPDRVVMAGIDEAGLGPLLGPLCVGVAAFSLPTGHPALTDDGPVPGAPVDLWRLLDGVVARAPTAQRTDPRTVITDSKRLHKPASIEPLERSVLSLAVADRLLNQAAADPAFTADAAAPPADFRAFVEAVSLRRLDALADYPWYSTPDRPGGGLADDPLPTAALAERIAGRAVTLARAMAAHDLRIDGIRVRPVPVGEFNQLLDRCPTKADAHFTVIAAALRALWQRFPVAHVVVDRQGGRDFYGPLLADSFPSAQIDALFENREVALPEVRDPTLQLTADDAAPVTRISAYVMSDGARRLTVSFARGGEQVALPVAVASMFAKYLREGCMRALNRHFGGLVPGLKPTKGYVTDGRRFLADLESAGIDLAPWRARLVRNK
jgi:hypothetical protein